MCASLSSLLPFASVHRPHTRSSPAAIGSVKLAEPTGEARAVVIYFSGRKGLSKADETAAQAMAKGGALVAEIDSRKYLRRLDKLKEKCHELVYDTELLTRQLERERRLPTYLTPIVAGVGEGGTLAELNLVQAPAVTIAGAVSIDPAETIASRRPICSDLPTTARRGGYQLRCSKKIARLLDSRIDTDRSAKRIANTS